MWSVWITAMRPTWTARVGPVEVEGWTPACLANQWVKHNPASRNPAQQPADGRRHGTAAQAVFHRGTGEHVPGLLRLRAHADRQWAKERDGRHVMPITSTATTAGLWIGEDLLDLDPDGAARFRTLLLIFHGRHAADGTIGATKGSATMSM
jgi:hypothetical protein